jgi:hypothetical protein
MILVNLGAVVCDTYCQDKAHRDEWLIHVSLEAKRHALMHDHLACSR